jgi:2-dehydro-3-deoxygalactonokinase
MTLADTCVLYIDGGTTRTRAWAVVGDRVVASARASVGARDGARDGSSRRLAEAVRHLVRKVGERCRAQGEPAPALGVAAGMIGSAEGLVEVPHVEAPAGAGELARGAVCRELAEIAPLPIVFVPGIRSGPARAEREDIGRSDVMRGEEALGIGLIRTGPLTGGGVMLSLGSHWKAVYVDAEGRIMASTSTLAGELMHAVRSHTILASSVPDGWPLTLPADWVAAGVGRGRGDGLPRALYCVRLLDQRTASRPEDRLAFLVGATIAANEEALLPPASGKPRRVVLAGAPALAAAWEGVLRERGLEPVTIDEDERESAFRAGCRAVLDAGEVETEPTFHWRSPR